MSDSRILLLDMYTDRLRRSGYAEPYIQSYLRLGAFLDHVGVSYDIYRMAEGPQGLAPYLAQHRYQAVFVNVIMGQVLGRLEPALRAIKAVAPEIRTWVGGVGVHFLQEMLARSPFVDRVSLGNPYVDAAAFHLELIAEGLAPPRTLERPWSLLSNHYLPAFLHQHLGPDGPVTALALTTSGGCPNTCNFCYRRVAPQWQQPADLLLGELSELHRRFGLGYLEFHDDNLVAHWPRLRKLTRQLRALGLQFPYFCLGSIEQISEPVLDEMVESGLTHLLLGVETIHDQGLAWLGKGYHRGDIDQALRLLTGYPIDLTLTFVLGWPGETRHHLQQQFEWIADIRPTVCSSFFFAPYPGTPAMQLALEGGMSIPTSLAEWATIADMRLPITALNPALEAAEYSEWQRKFDFLTTRAYRGCIGESARRSKDFTAQYPQFP